MAEPITRRGVSICVFRGDSVLMVRRSKAPDIGLWAPVGGMIEPGESPEEAALREMLEETGVACRLLGESGRRDIARDGPDGPWRIVLHVFAAAWISGEPIAASDALDARFIALDALDELDLVGGVVPFIEGARRLFDGQSA